MVAPQFPSSGWSIDYEAAFTRFISNPARLPYAGAVSDWIVSCRLIGPPADGLDTGDDFYLARVLDTPVVAEYLVIAFEFLIVCREFR